MKQVNVKLEEETLRAFKIKLLELDTNMTDWVRNQINKELIIGTDVEVKAGSMIPDVDTKRREKAMNAPQAPMPNELDIDTLETTGVTKKRRKEVREKIMKAPYSKPVSGKEKMKELMEKQKSPLCKKHGGYKVSCGCV